MDEQIASLEKAIKEIQERNKRVEANKAWETSWTRRVSIALSTYFVVSVLMYSMGATRPFLDAIIPAIAYLISTTTLSIVHNWWLTNQK